MNNYYIFITISLFLHCIYKLDGIKKMINGTIDDQSPSNATTRPKASFAEIGVYFQSLNKKLVYEEPKYTVRLRF